MALLLNRRECEERKGTCLLVFREVLADDVQRHEEFPVLLQPVLAELLRGDALRRMKDRCQTNTIWLESGTVDRLQ